MAEPQRAVIDLKPGAASESPSGLQMLRPGSVWGDALQVNYAADAIAEGARAL